MPPPAAPSTHRRARAPERPPNPPPRLFLEQLDALLEAQLRAARKLRAALAAEYAALARRDAAAVATSCRDRDGVIEDMRRLERDRRALCLRLGAGPGWPELAAWLEAFSDGGALSSRLAGRRAEIVSLLRECQTARGANGTLAAMLQRRYFVVTSISTITLYIAYNTPTFLNVRNKLRKKGEYTTKEKSPWFLKGWGPVINIIAVVYTIFICIVFMLPPNELVLWTMVLLGVLLLIYWFACARSHFKGPQKASEEELRRIEAELDRLAHAHGDD